MVLGYKAWKTHVHVNTKYYTNCDLVTCNVFPQSNNIIWLAYMVIGIWQFEVPQNAQKFCNPIMIIHFHYISIYILGNFRLIQKFYTACWYLSVSLLAYSAILLWKLNLIDFESWYCSLGCVVCMCVWAVNLIRAVCMWRNPTLMTWHTSSNWVICGYLDADWKYIVFVLQYWDHLST